MSGWDSTLPVRRSLLSKLSCAPLRASSGAEVRLLSVLGRAAGAVSVLTMPSVVRVHKNVTPQGTVNLLRRAEHSLYLPPQTPTCHSVKMADDRNSAALSEPLQTSEPAPGSIDPSSQLSPQSPGQSRESADHFDGWEIIGEQQDFYDERDCLDPGSGLASPKLRNRDDHVLIFDYSLDPDYLKSTNGNHSVEEGGPSSVPFSADDDIFFRVSKNELIESKQFDQIINPAGESPLVYSRGPRLGIM